MEKRPDDCRYPDCFNCTYPDCVWDGMTSAEYTDTNKRDYAIYYESTGYKYHKKDPDQEYRKSRDSAYKSEHPEKRKEDPEKRLRRHREYYWSHREEIRKKMRARYNTEENTLRCRKYRQEHLEERKEYDRIRYRLNAEKFREQRRERYWKQKQEAEAAAKNDR